MRFNGTFPQKHPRQKLTTTTTLLIFSKKNTLSTHFHKPHLNKTSGILKHYFITKGQC